MENRNVEIKAGSIDFSAQSEIAASIATEPPVSLTQEDTFFHVPSGRLKLREFENGGAEVIQYRRPDALGPKQSTYVRSQVSEPSSLKEALANSLGIRAVVKKRRKVFMAGQTRIHMDEVEGLGEFIELEVVLNADQAESEGVAIAEDIMRALGIKEEHLLSCAYVDLLAEFPRRDAEQPILGRDAASHG